MHTFCSFTFLSGRSWTTRPQILVVELIRCQNLFKQTTIFSSTLVQTKLLPPVPSLTPLSILSTGFISCSNKSIFLLISFQFHFMHHSVPISQCNLERINESADMQAKVIQILMKIIIKMKMKIEIKIDICRQIPADLQPIIKWCDTSVSGGDAGQERKSPSRTAEAHPTQAFS